jgi:hypothetical protein
VALPDATLDHRIGFNPSFIAHPSLEPVKDRNGERALDAFIGLFHSWFSHCLFSFF